MSVEPAESTVSLRPEHVAVVPKHARSGVTSVLSDGVASVVISLSALGHAMAWALLVFAGPLSDETPRAVAVFGAGAALTMVYTGLSSRLHPAVSVLQDGPGVVLVTVAAAIGSTGTSTDVFVMLALTTLLTGALMWLIGVAELANLVRYVPTTVVAAFLGGTGYILVRGGIEVMIQQSITWDSLDQMLWGDMAKFWVPGFVFGLALFTIRRLNLHPAVISASLVASIGVFYAVAAVVSSRDTVEREGWLIGPFPDGSGTKLVSPAELFDAGWSIIGGQYAGIAGAVGVATLIALMNLSALGYAMHDKVALDDELRSAGIGNVLLAPFGVIPAFVAIGDSVLANELAPRRRAIPVVAGVLTAGLAIVGTELLGLVPRSVIGASLVLVGMALVVQWLGDLRRSGSGVDRAVGVAIFVVIAWAGIVEGIVVGVLAACVVFVVRSSRLDPIRRSGTLGVFKSRVDRTPAEQLVLSESARRAYVVELQGHLFFGSVARLEERFLEVIESGESVGAVDQVIVDFRGVTGVDSSALPAIEVLIDTLSERGIAVSLSCAPAGLSNSWRVNQGSELGKLGWFDTLDESLEVVESRLLSTAAVEPQFTPGSSLGLSQELLDEFVEQRFAAGDVAMVEGDVGDHLFVVESGSMTAYRRSPDGNRQRLRRFGAGAVVGEIALFTGERRTADIVADTEVVAHGLSRQRYDQLRKEKPQKLMELHEYVVRVQAARIISLSAQATQSAP